MGVAHFLYLYPTSSERRSEKTHFSLKKLTTMAVLKVIEILSDSEKSWEDATQKGILKASKSIKHIIIY